ncbi:serine/threonine-protein kinase [Paractinoplanes durhamensis]|uniref:serine/threonine-protein kinase n=1 Tax=Paractinoplanes durhamensis TaxID=113563 RepID=UPI003637F541
MGSSYVLQHPIGQGATGTVWRGVDRSTGEPVAVKLLHESLLRQPKLVTRFVQERTILLMLRHRNVVRVRDLFSVGETLGLVMDLVEGGSLRDHLREHGTVAAGEAARLAAQVASALAEAHELGVVHRDLKPDNILLRVEGGRLDTRLTDFGVARILNTPSMTTPNAVVGTPHYMAPEAFHGTTASPATDVYALGVLLYELVSGRPPYDSDSIPDLMRRHMEGHPRRRPGVPDEIWDVIEDCMAGKPRLRPSAAELVVALSDAARVCGGARALPRPRGVYTDPGSAYADDSAFYPNGLSDARARAAAPGPVLPAARAAPARLTGTGTGADRRAGLGRDGTGGVDGEEAVSLLPVPRKPVSGEPVLRDPVSREPELREPVPPPEAERTNAVPRWRWLKRPGATMALIAAAMVASAVATTAWNYGRAEGQPQDIATERVLAAPAGSPAPSGSNGRAPRKVARSGAAVPVEQPGSAAARSVTHTRTRQGRCTQGDRDSVTGTRGKALWALAVHAEFRDRHDQPDAARAGAVPDARERHPVPGLTDRTGRRHRQHHRGVAGRGQRPHRRRPEDLQQPGVRRRRGNPGMRPVGGDPGPRPPLLGGDDVPVRTGRPHDRQFVEGFRLHLVTPRPTRGS